MHITGIVAEYNPFHNGHAYQITETKKQTNCDFIVAVMSGNFSQRGIPTIVDKFKRTQMALAGGVDLVLELPTPFATASAERFSEASISLFHKTGIINTLSFGSELGNTHLLSQIARLLLESPPVYDESLKYYLRSGLSFPRAREKAVKDYFSQTTTSSPSLKELEEAISSPNNILGIEYIKALYKYDASIRPITIKRLKAGYHETQISSHIASATAIRHHFKTDNHTLTLSAMPDSTYNLLQNTSEVLPSADGLSAFLHYKLMFSQKEDLYSLWDIPQELLHTIINNYKNYSTFTELVDAITSKTYTRATVQRSLLRIILELSSHQMLVLKNQDWIPYIRVLGCKKSASHLLGYLSQKSSVPIITNLSRSYHTLDSVSKDLIDYETKATALYHYLCHRPDLYNQDFTQPFVKL